MDNMRFGFPAAQGVQGGRTFYTACVPFSMLARMLAIDTGNVLDRSQRNIDPKRAKKISQYICDNTDSFVLPALTGVVVDETLTFVPAAKNSSVGELSLSMDALIKLFDGQHRATGIMDALKEMYSALKGQQVTIQLFVNMSLAERQQAFSDINSNAKPVSTSLNLAYNKRNEQAQQFNELIGMVDSWQGVIDYESNIVKQGSDKLFSFRHIVDANQLLLGLKKGDEPDERQLVAAARWWNIVADFAGWNLPSEKRVSQRSSMITLNAVGLMVLARIGAAFIENPSQANAVAAALGSIGWARDSEFWQGNIVGADGNLVTNSTAQAEAANAVIRCIAPEKAEVPVISTKGMVPITTVEEAYEALGIPKDLVSLNWHIQGNFLFKHGCSDYNFPFINFKKQKQNSDIVYPVLCAFFYTNRITDATPIGEFKSWDEAAAAVSEFMATREAA